MLSKLPPQLSHESFEVMKVLVHAHAVNEKDSKRHRLDK